MNSFEELGLSPELLSAIRALGFEKPFPIQEAIIPLLWSGSDVVGQAHTGTGKTAAFGLPILEIIDEKNHSIQAVVLVPTRELAVQVASDINSYGRFTRKHALAIYGGQSINTQIQALKRYPQIIVGTPGRLIDHLERGSLSLEDVQCVVLDEADRMLDMGFIHDVERILGRIKRKHQTACFSATIPDEVLRLTKKYMKNPREILIEMEDLNVKEISQYFCQADFAGKLEALLELLGDEKVQRAIVFCRTRRSSFWLSESLRRRNQNATAINGDLTQRQRDRAMQSFRNGSSRILVATDVAGRGLDIDDVTHIINYDVPEDPHSYFHRIGRTGRAGKTGTAVTIVSAQQSADFRVIQRMANNRIEPLHLKSRQNMPISRNDEPNRSQDREFRRPKEKFYRRFGNSRHPAFRRKPHSNRSSADRTRR